MPRLQKWVEPTPLFDHHRVNEQLLKAMDRKVWLPSGGSLVIDRTEAMTVVDVNTGKFTGKGGNLEETVTKNNLEAAEEIVRQLRLRDIGGIIVVDFIDMVLESNRELVMRRLKECLGRDRTKHQVAEVTSLGLVQMTRKRISQGLIEAFSETCEHCNGRGIKVHTDMLGGTAGGSRRSDAAKPRPIPKPIPRPPALVPAAATGNGAGPAPAAAVGVPDGPGVDGGALAGPGEVPAAPDGAAPDATAADPTSVDGAASVTGAAADEGTGRGRRSRGGRSRRGRGGGDAAVAGDGAPGEAAAAPADGDPVETAAAPAVRGPNARAARTPVLPKVSRVIDDTEDDWAWAAGPVQEPAQDEAPVMAEAIGDAADGAAADGDAAADESTPKKPARRRGGRGRGKAAAVGAGTDS
jgi:ribonuclease E